MSQRSTPVVRRAEPGDADTLATLGRALNAHQGDPSTYFTAEAVRRDGFGEPPRFEAWIAEVNGQAVGYALVVPSAYETSYAKAGVYVQDVFVAPEARQLGVGRALMAAVAADARRRGLEFVWWASRTWNTESHAFFRTLATVEEPVIAFATFGDEFNRLADEGE
jgi:GNAT superfamily N-acetyltransferase